MEGGNFVSEDDEDDGIDEINQIFETHKGR